MELRHLRYFVAVANELHFGRAADRLKIAPPTLSTQIRALEAHLGAQLLTRKTKSAVSLTKTGQRFLEEAQATIQQAERAELTGRRVARGDLGTVEVGYILTASCIGLLPEAIAAFRRSHPDVSFVLQRKDTFPQIRSIMEGALDVGFVRAPKTYPPGLTGFIVHRHPYLLAIPSDHALAKRDRISPEMLIDEPFVSASAEMEVGFWDNFGVIDHVGLSPRVAARAADIFSVLTLVAAGIGISVISEPMQKVIIPGIVYRRIVGTTKNAEIAVVHRKSEPAPAVRLFLRLLRTRAGSPKPR